MVLNLPDLQHDAERMTRLWKMTNVDILFEGEPYAHLEMVIHEAAHAASLGIPFDSYTPKLVGQMIHELEDDDSDSLKGKHSEDAFDEEAKAWAIEWEVLKRIGLDKIYTWALAVEGAAEQGVDEARLEKFVGTASSRAGADVVVGWLADMGRRVDRWSVLLRGDA